MAKRVCIVDLQVATLQYELERTQAQDAWSGRKGSHTHPRDFYPFCRLMLHQRSINATLSFVDVPIPGPVVSWHYSGRQMSILNSSILKRCPNFNSASHSHSSFILPVTVVTILPPPTSNAILPFIPSSGNPSLLYYCSQKSLSCCRTSVELSPFVEPCPLPVIPFLPTSVKNQSVQSSCSSCIIRSSTAICSW